MADTSHVTMAVEALHAVEGTGCEHFVNTPEPGLVCDWHKMEAVVDALNAVK